MKGRSKDRLSTSEKRSLKDYVFSSALYTSSLQNRTPKRLAHIPVDIISGDPTAADKLFKGSYCLQGITNEITGRKPWDCEEMPLYWHQELHRFNWLRDFTANGSDSAKRHIRPLIADWIVEFGEYQSIIWDPEILSQRVKNWMMQSQFLLTSNDGDFNYKFLKSLRIQLQHLQRYCRYFAREPFQFNYYLSLYLGAACFSDTQDQAPRLKKRMLDELDKEILQDGPHVTRSPSKQLHLLADVISLRETLRNMDKGIPDQLVSAIDRLTTATRFFQHGDGDLALFNGGFTVGEGRCDQLLAMSEVLGRAPHHLKQGGFERLKAGRALVLFESGQSGRSEKLQHYKGLGSFELSYGRERLIVNCGAHPDPQSPWYNALAATAAHSTLSVADTNSDFPKTGSMNEDNSPVSVLEDGGNLWLEFENSGYENSEKIRHTRRLYLAADGKNLRGEDTVQSFEQDTELTEFVIRFHIHPDVTVSKSMGGRSFLMLTKQGVGWQFLTSLSEAELEDSVYCPAPGIVRNNRQIVLKGRVHGQEELSIKWALQQKGDVETSDT
ncbi:heparinase II/III family protein [Sneathiella glossodoripedis]|uniref:heparinase II/III family protein n=1 Tax=Sneathiella glossodoripedis TaxID=418853 RepID=UPI00046F93E5|nr:heparinase II/III family protein [Sneathiella glossodoripedis]